MGAAASDPLPDPVSGLSRPPADWPPAAVSTAAGVRAGRLRPAGGVSRSSSRSKLDLGGEGLGAAAAGVAALTAVGVGFFADVFVGNSSSELEELSELLSLSSWDNSSSHNYRYLFCLKRKWKINHQLYVFMFSCTVRYRFHKFFARYTDNIWK
jgi:hypothetical protein